MEAGLDSVLVLYICRVSWAGHSPLQGARSPPLLSRASHPCSASLPRCRGVREMGDGTPACGQRGREATDIRLWSRAKPRDLRCCQGCQRGGGCGPGPGITAQGVEMSPLYREWAGTGSHGLGAQADPRSCWGLGAEDWGSCWCWWAVPILRLDYPTGAPVGAGGQYPSSD